MRLLDIMTSPWMIIPEKLSEIKAIYSSHMRGEKIDFRAIEEKINAALGLSTKRTSTEYEIVNGVAVIPVKGVITSEPSSFFDFLFGGASTRDITIMFRSALANDNVTSILLIFHSPGGTTAGVRELAELIYDSRGIKPLASFTDGDMASAAYYIGAAAGKIYISNGYTHTGSIGVWTSHFDYSKADEMHGYKETDIYAGKYKCIATGNRPLSDEGREYLQDRVDYIYSIFVDDIAKYRGVSVDDALERMADGRLFIGRQAIDAGLVDGVATMDGLINTDLPVMQSALSARLWLENLNKEARDAKLKGI